MTGSGTILLLRGGALGDFLLTLPALRRLRRGLPAARLELVCQPAFGALAEKEGLVDAVHRLDHTGLAPFFAPRASLPHEWIERFQSASVVISWLFDPLDQFRSHLERLGVNGLLQGCWKPEDNGIHASRQLAAVLERLALFEEEGEGNSLSFPNGSPGAQLALHPGSGGEGKLWPLENWDRLLRDWLARHPDQRALVVTGEVEVDRGIRERLRRAWEGLPLDWADSLPLPELAGRLAHAGCFVGHDSGPSHLAAAVGTPTLALFGPTDPAVWAPRGFRVETLQDPGGRLADLPVEKVAAAIEALGAD